MENTKPVSPEDQGPLVGQEYMFRILLTDSSESCLMGECTVFKKDNVRIKQWTNTEIDGTENFNYPIWELTLRAQHLEAHVGKLNPGHIVIFRPGLRDMDWCRRVNG